ncbi:MAG: hypothetical protein JO261_04395 [Alphaproteobacteria bacterium]|nr:hypothetical protein [Alphaproteobacteria bacterium]MBV9692920.1 hypothetical protein [Alphaproteobacteria bacterium]
MFHKVRSPFAGKPATRQIADHNGAPGFQVQPRVLTPIRAMAVNWLTGIAVVAGVGYGLAGVASSPSPDSGMLTAAVAVPLVGGFVLYEALRSLFRKRVQLMFTLDRFSVKTLFGWKHYDRLLPHRFALLQHDWTQAEQEQQEFQAALAQRRGKLIRKQRWFGKSFHVSFDYLGQRNDVLTVYGPKEAMAIVTRLNACDSVLDALARRGQGTPLTPADEWGDQPGAIPK